MAHVYLIHFNNKLYHAGHYLGYRTCLPNRPESHKNTTGLAPRHHCGLSMKPESRGALFGHEQSHPRDSKAHSSARKTLPGYALSAILL